MRYTLLDSPFIHEMQLSISVSAVPVPIWCWVNKKRSCTCEDLQETSFLSKLAFDDQLAVTETVPLGSWRIKEFSTMSDNSVIYMGNLHTLPCATRLRLFSAAGAPPKASQSPQRSLDYFNDFIFNDAHDYNVNTAKEFPLSEYLVQNTGSQYYAISWLFEPGVVSSNNAAEISVVCRSFLARLEGYLLGLRHNTVNTVKKLVSQSIRLFISALERITQLNPAGENLVSLAEADVILSIPTESSLPSAFAEVFREYGQTSWSQQQQQKRMQTLDTLKCSQGFKSMLLFYESEQELLGKLNSLRSEVLDSHYLMLDSIFQGIRTANNQLCCNYITTRYTELQYESMVKLLNIYHTKGASFVNLVVSNICSAEFSVVYLGPPPFVKLLNDTITTLLPEHRRQLFKSHAVTTPFTTAYCTCNNGHTTLLLENKSAICPHSLYYSFASARDIIKAEPRKSRTFSQRKADGGASMLRTDSVSELESDEVPNTNKSDVSHESQKPQELIRYVCSNCNKPFYIPELHVEASSQILSTDILTGYIFLQQLCAITARPVCVVNLLALDIESSCFIMSHFQMQMLQKLLPQRAEKMVQVKKNIAHVLTIKPAGLYQDSDSMFYYHLIKRLLNTRMTSRPYMLSCRLLRLQYYFSSMVELELLNYLRFIEQDGGKSPRSRSPRGAMPKGESGTLSRLSSTGSLRNLAKVTELTGLVDQIKGSKPAAGAASAAGAVGALAVAIAGKYLPRAQPLYISLPISLQRMHSICGLVENSIFRLNSAFALKDSTSKEEPVIRTILTNSFRVVGFPDVFFPVSDTVKWNNICSGAFATSPTSCLVRFRSTPQIITTDIVPFGVSNISNHGIVSDNSEFPHASAAMKYGILS